MKRCTRPRWAFVLLVVLVAAGTAWGAAATLESIPADGEVLAHAPSEVVLRFDVPVDPALARYFLYDVRGTGIPIPAQRQASAPTDRLAVVLPPLGRGSYLLRYRVVAGDGQATYGTVRFTTGGY